MKNKWITTTDWSLVARAADVDLDVKRRALTELLHRYLPALQLHLTAGRGFKPDQADDVIQGFLLSKILEQDLIGRVQKEKGRFRSFLLTALDRFAIDWRRSQQRLRLQTVDLDDHPEPAAAAMPGSAGSSFDLAWARQVLRETIRRMQAECLGLSHARVWQVFEKRVLQPALEQTPRPSYETLVAELGFQSPSQASNALVTAKRMFQRILRSVIAEYEAGEVDIEAEIADLHRILGALRA